MAIKQRFEFCSCRLVYLLACAAALLLSPVELCATQGDRDSQLKRYRVFSLRKIPAEQGKKYLAVAQIGTVSQLAGSNTLLVTGSPEELVRSSSLLQLVDSDQQFSVEIIRPAWQVSELPAIDKIAAYLGDVSIGTFLSPPLKSAANRAIIDVTGDNVVVVAPAVHLQRIISAVDRLEGAEPQQPALTGSAQARADKVPEDSDKLFGELLKSLSEAEKIAARQQAEQNAAQRQPDRAVDVSRRAHQEVSGQLKLRKKDSGLAQVPQAERAVLPIEQQERLETKQPPRIAEPLPAEDETVIAEPNLPRRSYSPEPVDIGDEMLELDLPAKLNIIDLVDLVGKYLNLDYMYDTAVVKGDVSLKLQGPMKIKDLYPLLESVLKFKGFVMSRKGNLVTIVPSDKALEIDPALLDDQGGRIQYGDVIVTRVFTLQYIDTASAQNLLKGMNLGAAITAISETSTLIVTGYAYRMSRVEELLRMVDKPGEPRDFRFRQLTYTMAKNLAPKVEKLAEELGTVSITIAAPAKPTPKPATRRTRARRTTPAKRPTPAAKAKKPTVYLDADERTNRILMIGHPEQLDVVEQLISALDVEKQDLRSLRMYEIQHVGAEEVKAKLEELGIIGAGGGPQPSRARARPTRTQRTAKSPAPAAASTTIAGATEPLAEEPQVVIIESTNSLLVNATAEQHAQIAIIIGYVDTETLEMAIPYEVYPLENQSPEELAEVLNKLVQETIKDKEGKIEKVVKKQEDIVIVADNNTFSIIVYASKKNQEWIRKLISTLDKRRPQVLIDVSLVEITREDIFDYDLNLIANTKHLVTGNIAVTGDTLPNSGSRGNELEGGWNQTVTSTDGTVTHTGFRGFLGEDKIQALLTAINQKNYGRVLAKPKILVNDNEEGTIKTTEKTFIPEETMTYPGTTTGTTPIPVKSTTWKDYEAKIELKITPNISEGDLLRLEISMLREDFQKQDVGPPDYRTSNVDTIVTVPNGSTIILGGLTKLNQAKGGSKVPLLGDIPLVGGLFRTVSNSDKTSKLYVFVKANILRPDETIAGLAQLDRISAKNREAFEEAERRFQKEENWPGIKPEPIDPLRVLETE